MSSINLANVASPKDKNSQILYAASSKGMNRLLRINALIMLVNVNLHLVRVLAGRNHEDQHALRKPAAT